MSLIDFILNLAGLLLWLNWRAIRLDPLTRATPATLAGTLRRAEPMRLKRWHFLALLAALVFFRAVFYWQLSPAVNWTPKLDLGAVALAFGANSFAQKLLFSILSFMRVLLVFYFWLLTLALINHQTPSDPVHKALLLQLGRVTRWPWIFQALTPLILVAALWALFHPLLSYLGIINPARTNLHLLEQALLVGAGTYLSLKFLLPGFLFLHLIASYVYLGASPFWDFISATGRNLLKPLSKIPLRAGKFDFAPLVEMLLILGLLHVLPTLLQIQLNSRNLTLWPP
jgi:uncharacterized protein YggT (Ycf19 family)